MQETLAFSPARSQKRPACRVSFCFSKCWAIAGIVRSIHATEKRREINRQERKTER